MPGVGARQADYWAEAFPFHLARESCFPPAKAVSAPLIGEISIRGYAGRGSRLEIHELGS